MKVPKSNLDETAGSSAKTAEFNGSSDHSDEEIGNIKNHTEEDHHGGHGHQGPTLTSLASSAVVCFIIYFVFCIVFSAVVFEPLVSSSNPPFGVPQGVGINLMGIAVGCFFFAFNSGCRAVIAGPDLLPIIFVAEAGIAVMTYVEAHDTSNVYEDDDHYHRFLAGDGPNLSATAVAKVIPTTLVAMMIGNAVTGLLFYGLGKMKTTASSIGLIPASVIAGFLTCIGYKVVKLAVLITTGYSFKMKYIHNLGNQLPHANDPWLPLFIALVHGISLYALKRKHIFPAEKLILAFIAGPLALFFIVTTIVGADLDSLRADGWFLSQKEGNDSCDHDCAFPRTAFWQPLFEAYGSSNDNIAWGALPGCIPIFLMGSCITTLDNMLKLTSSENALEVDLDYNHEMQLGGKATLTSTLLVGAPAYGQTKFNVINLSIGRTSDSRIPTLGCGVLCFLLLLSGLTGPIINIIPRFLLGGLCVFAGVGFLYENLWEGRKTMTKISFGIVWAIFLVNFIWEFFILAMLPKFIQPMVPGLLLVFGMGIVLSTFEFMFAFMHKAKPPLIRRGEECCSSSVRTEKHEHRLAVMAPWFQVFSVESFIFFGTANTLYQQLKEHLAEQKRTKPKAERTKYLIFDLENVTGIDPTAKNVFRKVHRLLKHEGVHLVWAMKHSCKYYTKFKDWGLHKGVDEFASLDLALHHVEDKLLQYAHVMSQKWTTDAGVKALFEQKTMASIFSISVRSDEKTFSSARLKPYAEKVYLPTNTMLCEDDDDNLYLLYSGEVMLTSRGSANGLVNNHFIFTGSFFNLDRTLVGLGALSGPASTLCAVTTKDSVVLRVSQKKLLEIQQNDGGLAQKLFITLLCQNEKYRPGRLRVAPHRVKEDVTPPTEPKCLFQDVLEEGPSQQSVGDGEHTLAERLMDGKDYKVNLTESQKKRFAKIFELIAADGGGDDEIEMAHFAKHVTMNAMFHGSALSHSQFLAMIDESGIDEDGDGVLTLDEFLRFLRQLFLADLPASEIPALKRVYFDEVERMPEGALMDEERIKIIFGKIGFDTKSPQMKNILGVIDSDGDGDVSFDEFLTGIGMMKLFYLHTRELNRAFFEYKSKSRLNVISEDTDNNELNAYDLRRVFKVSMDEANEMVFLADQDDFKANSTCNSEEFNGPCRTIDFSEFRDLVLVWT